MIPNPLNTRYCLLCCMENHQRFRILG
jgi:hypothetical protein